MVNIKYNENNSVLEKEFGNTDDAYKFMAEHDVVSFSYLKNPKNSLGVMTYRGIRESIDESVLHDLSVESINETKKYDIKHGHKLGHDKLNTFFQNEAPKLNSLKAVEDALVGLYKQNNVEYTPKVISQIISSYKKKVKLTEDELDEIVLTSKEKQDKDKLVINIKKNLKQNRQKYKDKELANIQTLATVIVKN